MTNVSATPLKRATRKGLFAFGIETLEKEGWTVCRVPRGGKSSLRLITRDAKKHKVSIRTSQDTWIAFPRKSAEAGWVTLDDVDYVVAVSVNDKHNPTEARVHMIPADDARERYNRAYEARKTAGHTLSVGRGIWLSLYDVEAAEPVSYVGAGMGVEYPPIANVNISTDGLPQGGDEVDEDTADEDAELSPAAIAEGSPLTIPEAKRRLAEALGVPETAVKITIEH